LFVVCCLLFVVCCLLFDVEREREILFESEREQEREQERALCRHIEKKNTSKNKEEINKKQETNILPHSVQFERVIRKHAQKNRN
jgi:hypothetical protein